MLPYIFMFALPGLLAVFGIGKSRWLILLVAFVYWIMLGFRFQVGMDWNNYLYIYDSIKTISLMDAITRREPGFVLLQVAAYRLGGGLILVFAIAALVFCIGFFAVAARCREPFLAIVVATGLLVVAFAMSGARQVFALGIICYLCATWENRRSGSRVALVLLASLFHFSAIFMLIYVALSARLPAGIKTLVAIVMIGAIVTITRLYPQSMESYSRLYVSGSDRYMNAPGAVVQVGIIAVFGLLYLIKRKDWIVIHGENALYYNMAWSSLLLLPCILISSVGAYRFGLYLWPMAMYVAGGLPTMTQDPKERVLYRALLVFGAGLILVGWLEFANTSAAWIPYQNWLLQPEGVSLLRHRFMH